MLARHTSYIKTEMFLLIMSHSIRIDRAPKYMNPDSARIGRASHPTKVMAAVFNIEAGTLRIGFPVAMKSDFFYCAFIVIKVGGLETLERT